MGIARLAVSGALGPDGEIYGLGGSDVSGNGNSVEVYDPTKDQWTSGPALPGSLDYDVNGLAATSVDGTVYAMGIIDRNHKATVMYAP